MGVDINSITRKYTEIRTAKSRIIFATFSSIALLWCALHQTLTRFIRWSERSKRAANVRHAISIISDEWHRSYNASLALRDANIPVIRKLSRTVSPPRDPWWDRKRLNDAPFYARVMHIRIMYTSLSKSRESRRNYEIRADNRKRNPSVKWLKTNCIVMCLKREEIA